MAAGARCDSSDLMHSLAVVHAARWYVRKLLLVRDDGRWQARDQSRGHG